MKTGHAFDDPPDAKTRAFIESTLHADADAVWAALRRCHLRAIVRGAEIACMEVGARALSDEAVTFLGADTPAVAEFDDVIGDLFFGLLAVDWAAQKDEWTQRSYAFSRAAFEGPPARKH